MSRPGDCFATTGGGGGWPIHRTPPASDNFPLGQVVQGAHGAQQSSAPFPGCVKKAMAPHACLCW